MRRPSWEDRPHFGLVDPSTGEWEPDCFDDDRTFETAAEAEDWRRLVGRPELAVAPRPPNVVPSGWPGRPCSATEVSEGVLPGAPGLRVSVVGPSCGRPASRAFATDPGGVSYRCRSCPPPGGVSYRCRSCPPPGGHWREVSLREALVMEVHLT